MYARHWCALYWHHVRTEFHEKCLSSYFANPKLPCHLCYFVDDLICKVLCRSEVVCKCGSHLCRSYMHVCIDLVLMYIQYFLFMEGMPLCGKCSEYVSTYVPTTWRDANVTRVIWILHACTCAAWIIFLDKIPVRKKKWDLYAFSSIAFHVFDGILSAQFVFERNALLLSNALKGV